MKDLIKLFCLTAIIPVINGNSGTNRISLQTVTRVEGIQLTIFKSNKFTYASFISITDNPVYGFVYQTKKERRFL